MYISLVFNRSEDNDDYGNYHAEKKADGKRKKRKQQQEEVIEEWNPS